jgi:hypothetical protein
MTITPRQIEWFSSILPRLRAYRQNGVGTQHFFSILMALENNCYRGLMHLEFASVPEFEGVKIAKVDLPELRTLSLDFVVRYSLLDFLSSLSTPRLFKLRLGPVMGFGPTARLLEHLQNYPLLKEFVLQYWNATRPCPQEDLALGPVKSVDKLSLSIRYSFGIADYLVFVISKFSNLSSLILDAARSIQGFQAPNITLTLPRFTSLTLQSRFQINCSPDELLALFSKCCPEVAKGGTDSVWKG